MIRHSVELLSPKRFLRFGNGCIWCFFPSEDLQNHQAKLVHVASRHGNAGGKIEGVNVELCASESLVRASHLDLAQFGQAHIRQLCDFAVEAEHHV